MTTEAQPGTQAEAAPAAPEMESMLVSKEPTDAGQPDAGTTPAATDEPGEKPPGEEVEQEAGAPETYEAFVMPEGMELNAEKAEAFMEMARKDNLSQAQAQAYVDVAAQLVADTQAKVQGALQEQWQGMLTQWVDDLKTDKEFGGAKLPESMSIARKAISTFGTPELEKALLETGMTNHPELFRAFYRVGLTLSPDSLHTGRGTTAPEAGMYGYMNDKPN